MFFLDNLFMGNSNYYRLFPILVLLILNAFTTTSSFELLESENVDIEKEDKKIVLNIGHLIPRTGDLAPYSEGFARGAELAIDQLKQDPLFSNYTLELKEYDTKSNEEGSEQALKDAINNNSKFIIGVISQSDSYYSFVKPLTVSSGIPFIISGYYSEFMDNYTEVLNNPSPFDDYRTSDNPFGIYSVDNYYMEIFYDTPYVRNYSNITVIHRNDAWASYLAEWILDGNPVRTSEIVINYNSTEELEEVFLKIKEANNEAIFALTYAKDGAALFQGLFELGITNSTDIYTIGDPRLIGENLATKEALEGIRIVDLEKEDSEIQSEFYALFQSIHDEAPRYKSFEHYESIIIGAQAYKSAQLNDSSLIEELKKYVIYVTADAGELSPWKLSRTPEYCVDTLVYQVKDGNFTAELVKQFNCVSIRSMSSFSSSDLSFTTSIFSIFAIIVIGILIRYKKIRSRRI